MVPGACSKLMLLLCCSTAQNQNFKPHDSKEIAAALLFDDVQPQRRLRTTNHNYQKTVSCAISDAVFMQSKFADNCSARLLYNEALHSYIGSDDNNRPRGSITLHGSLKPKSSVKPLGSVKQGAADTSHFSSTAYIIPSQRVDWPQYADNVGELCGFSFDEKSGFVAHGSEDANIWTKYADLHKKTRAQIEKGDMSSSRILVWQCRDGDLCGGIGDQAKGIASMLYLAVATDRALFVDWSKHGEDVLTLFDMRSVNTRLPHGVKLDDCQQFHAIDRDTNFEDYVASDATTASCIQWKTNTHPKTFWQPRMRTGTDSEFQQLHKQITTTVKKEYRIGCAFNFLWSLKPGMLELLEKTPFRRPAQVATTNGLATPSEIQMARGNQTFVGVQNNGINNELPRQPALVVDSQPHSPGLSESLVSSNPLGPKFKDRWAKAAPGATSLSQSGITTATPTLNVPHPVKAKYVSVHMRFGDEAFAQHQIGKDAKKQVDHAIDCARQL
eukprot:gnl/MRDRNA2_/MRDRNA2_18153_c0_seq1.p1 gnl/MRDRNA2_/MRDRNA2_18153_c0~~gnl/MRDRNA2_/MRDRNA2_18153_c0_seq1.p1  ORF type:complete len:499 (+),score=65.71 gnl/MRDRNA2_/MRDRNA2_18153_c0_seq1:92-1588(+)